MDIYIYIYTYLYIRRPAFLMGRPPCLAGGLPWRHRGGGGLDLLGFGSGWIYSMFIYIYTYMDPYLDPPTRTFFFSRKSLGTWVFHGKSLENPWTIHGKSDLFAEDYPRVMSK